MLTYSAQHAFAKNNETWQFSFFLKALYSLKPCIF